MHSFLRAGLVLTFLAAGSSGCSGVRTTFSSAPNPVDEGATRAASAPVAPSPSSLPAPAGLDDYKTQVARHLVRHNLDHIHQGILPPLLPAVVVLTITVDRDGQVADVQVQRSRNPDASAVALDAVRRSTPLPPPQQLAQAGGKLTFLETFLFADAERYQLRSLEPVQASE